MKQRVVITGVGCISPLGLDAKTSWAHCRDGQSGIRAVEDLDPGCRAKICGRVWGYQAKDYFTPKDIKRFDPFIQYGMVAADQAIEDAQMASSGIEAHRIGVMIGSGIGGLSYIEASKQAVMDHSARRISPFFIPSTIINMASGYVSIKHGFQGVNVSMVSACATSSHNIAFAYQMIAQGQADAMVAGGAEHASTDLGMGGFASLKALSTRNDAPEKASRPWDQARDGFILSDGGAVIVLESLESAQKRGAHIYAELCGVGYSSDAYHMTQPDPEGKGVLLAMEQTLQSAGVEKEKIQYINAHATSTPVGDGQEIQAIKAFFGDHANKMAVSSTKSTHGHMLGATGGMELIMSIHAMNEGLVPPTINLDDPDEACAGLNLVPHEAQAHTLNYVLSNSFGFGGTNCCLCLGHANNI